MSDITIALNDEELRRLQQAALSLGTTVERLVADEIRQRYALPTGQLLPFRKPKPVGDRK